MDRLCREAVASNANSLITTEKDLVKISRYRITLPLYVLKVTLRPGRGFEEYILKAIRES